ncbi:MAG: hypothetical protein Q8930_13815 [Bacillota bacterium]|nr:hypothetical protein [Bacillota bacterium]
MLLSIKIVHKPTTTILEQSLSPAITNIFIAPNSMYHRFGGDVVGKVK